MEAVNPWTSYLFSYADFCVSFQRVSILSSFPAQLQLSDLVLPSGECSSASLDAGYGFFFFFLRDGQLVTSPGSHSHLSSKQRQLYRLRTLPTSFATLFLASKPRNWDLVQGCVAPYTLVFWFFLEGPERSAYFSHPPRFGGYSGFGYYPFPWKGETPVRFLLTVSP